MTTLRQAAQAVLARWDSPSWQWSVNNSTADLMAALRTALEQQAEPVVDCPRCGHVCSQRLWQGLTPDEVKQLYPYGRSVWGKETFEAIEKALKEKNT